MDRERFVADVRAAVGPDRTKVDLSLAPMTTFHVGGPADVYAEVQTLAELAGALSAAAVHSVPVTILGGGSNVVVADEGIRGLVLHLHLNEISQPLADTVRAEAGVTINGLVRWTVGRGLAGVEEWAGTPGTVGGAIYGNAHWARKNIGDIVRRGLVISRSGMLGVVDGRDFGFAYDTSRLQRTGEILVWAEFAVAPGDRVILRERAKVSLHFRKETQPLAMPSAGCMFQNPDPARDTVPAGIPVSAGALIDRAGLKGRRIGGAMISERHANFIVNDGHATARDIRALTEEARLAVRERFGVTLRDEVVWLGA